MRVNVHSCWILLRVKWRDRHLEIGTSKVKLKRWLFFLYNILPKVLLIGSYFHWFYNFISRVFQCGLNQQFFMSIRLSVWGFVNLLISTNCDWILNGFCLFWSTFAAGSQVFDVIFWCFNFAGLLRWNWVAVCCNMLTCAAIFVGSVVKVCLLLMAKVLSILKHCCSILFASSLFFLWYFWPPNSMLCRCCAV